MSLDMPPDVPWPCAKYCVMICTECFDLYAKHDEHDESHCNTPWSPCHHVCWHLEHQSNLAVAWQADQTERCNTETRLRACADVGQVKKVQDGYATPEVPWHKPRKPSTVLVGQVTSQGPSAARPKRHTGPRWAVFTCNHHSCSS